MAQNHCTLVPVFVGKTQNVAPTVIDTQLNGIPPVCIPHHQTRQNAIFSIACEFERASNASLRIDQFHPLGAKDIRKYGFTLLVEDNIRDC